MPQNDDSNDKFYTESGRTGDKNVRLRALNRNSSLTGMSGYPSDSEYMKLVGEAGIEKQQSAMHDTANTEMAHQAARAARQKKTAAKYKGAGK